jgi:acetamidase/formamidase
MSRILLVLTLALPAFGQPKVLKATPQTVQWGYYSADAKPVLTVKSGEIVKVECVSTGSVAMFTRLNAPEDDALRDLKLITAEVKDKGPGGHVLTGPIGVEGAEPGNVLQVDILEIAPRSKYGYNSFGPNSGILTDDFPYSRSKLVPLDLGAMVAEFAPGIRIPLHPFFGSIGIGPAAGRVASGPPGYFAGNMDNKELVAGTTLYLPVQRPEGLLSIGDGHVAMGDGEVDVTAIETALTGTFRLTVRKDMHLLWPRAETPTHYITMGFHESLDEAIRRAAREMIDYLVVSKGMSKDDAYMLTSVAVDMHVTQAVDGVRGVHAMLPKAIFK